MLQMTDATL